MRAAITGVAALPVRKHLERSIRDSATEVALDAVRDAGLERRDIDALFCTPPSLSGHPGFMWSCTLAHHLGLTTRAQGLMECGGMSATLALRAAVDAVRAGRCRAALVVASDTRVIDPIDDLDYYLKSAIIRLIGLYGPCDGPYGIGAPIPYYAMSAQRYMH